MFHYSRFRLSVQEQKTDKKKFCLLGRKQNLILQTYLNS